MVLPANAIPEKRPEPLPPVLVDEAVKPVPANPVPANPVPVGPRPVVSKPDLEHLRLMCDGRRSDDGLPVVGCEWSPSERRDAAGYVVTRTNGDVREIILRTSDLATTSVLDTSIRFDVRYRYIVQVLNAQGRTIGTSGQVQAGVESPNTDLEVLKLRCQQVRPDVAFGGRDGQTVRCEWRAGEHPDAVGYQLWRIVDGDERELVWRGGMDTTAVRDRVGNDVSRATYVVLALGADGVVVGQSRPSVVRLWTVVPTRAAPNRHV